MEPTIQNAVDEENLWALAHAQVLESIERAIAMHGEARVGLAGGSTPKHLYELLVRDALPLEKITWILIDERYVSSVDAESNLGMLEKALFEPAQVPQENIVFFDTTLSTEESAQAMSNKITALENVRKPIFDLLILGAGSDGHIASLFENDPKLFTSQKAYTTSAPEYYKTKTRLTLSLDALTDAQSAMLILKGKEKEEVLNTIKSSEAKGAMALRLLSQKVPLKILTYFGS